MGGHKRREKSLRIGVHHANGVVWGPVYRTHLNIARSARKLSLPPLHSSATTRFAFPELDTCSGAGTWIVAALRSSGTHSCAYGQCRQPLPQHRPRALNVGVEFKGVRWS